MARTANAISRPIQSLLSNTKPTKSRKSRPMSARKPKTTKTTPATKAPTLNKMNPSQLSVCSRQAEPADTSTPIAKSPGFQCRTETTSNAAK